MTFRTCAPSSLAAVLVFGLTAPGASAQSYTWNTTPAANSTVKPTIQIGGDMTWAAGADAPDGYSYDVVDGSGNSIFSSSNVNASIDNANRKTTFSGSVSTSVYFGAVTLKITAWKLDGTGNKVNLSTNSVSLTMQPDP